MAELAAAVLVRIQDGGLSLTGSGQVLVMLFSTLLVWIAIGVWRG